MAAGRVSGKVAVVTGATGGIGEASAKRLAAEGARVIVSGRRQAEGERVVAEICAQGGQAAFQCADVSRAEDCAALITAARRCFGRIDILVNSAADLGHYDFATMSEEEWDRTFAVNVRGPYFCCREAIAQMREQGGGGSIVNIGTCQAYCGHPERVAYAASKAALLTMTRCLARGFLSDRIRVNWIIVGWVATPQEITYRNMTHGDGAAYLQEIADKRAIGRNETPEDVAAGVLFLASDESSHVTGCELNISGGLRI